MNDDDYGVFLNGVLKYHQEHKTPQRLIELIEMDIGISRDYFSGSFEFINPSVESLSEAWLLLDEPCDAFERRLYPFAGSDGTGSLYAFWRPYDGASLEGSPIVHLGSEGELDIIACTFDELLSLLLLDDPFYDDDRGREPHSPNYHLFKAWCEERGIKKRRARTITEKAEASYKDTFYPWFYSYAPDLAPLDDD